MTMTTTYTKTTTFTRIELIIIQFRNLLRQTTDISPDTLDKLEIGFEKRWIQKISVYALGPDNLCRGELFLSIDWDEHDRQIHRGNITIKTDERWANHTAIEVEEAIRLFRKFVDKNGLKTKWQVTHTSF